MNIENTKEVYSFHTFLFPFIWKTTADITIDKFFSVLSVDSDSGNKNSGRWISYDWEKRLETECLLSDEWLQDYQTYQYFTDSANELLFNCNGTNTVRCFYYGKCLSGKGKYIINKEKKSFVLNINNIRLNIYDAGIAILILELENRDNRSLDDVDLINEYGRRINFPYLTPGFSHNLCADSIEIQFDGASVAEGDENPFKEDYLKTSMNIEEYLHNQKQVIEKDDISFTFVMNPLQTLLDGAGKDNGKTFITTNYKHIENPPDNNNRFYIKPCVDDRMFVCCIVRDDKLSNELKGIGNDNIVYLDGLEKTLIKSGGEVKDLQGEVHDSYMEGWADETTLSSRLYKFFYIEKDLSCQSPVMRGNIMKKSVYDRWIQAGTIYGLTHHSICCITSDSDAVIYSVVNPFLIEYVQMAVLVLIQRSVILMLEDEAATVSNKFIEDKFVSENDIHEIGCLQAKYVKVKNQMFLSEVTTQEQGVELYEMLREQLYIEKNMNDLDSSMSNLRDVSEITNDRLERISDDKKNFSVDILSIGLAMMFILEPLSKLLEDYFELKQSVTWSVGAFALIIILLCIYLNYKKTGKLPGRK